VDGASFSAPNLLDRFPIAAGASFPIGSIGGVAAVTLTASQIPSHQHTGTTDGNNRGHTHQINSIKGGANTTTVQGGGGVTAVTNPPGTTPITEDESQNHTHTFTTGSIGGDGSHTNMPPYFGLLPVFRLC
jgi:microcystin-dependent protein